MPQIDILFKQMLQLQASDLHLASGSKPRVRVHGSMQELTGQPALSGEALRAMLEEIAPPGNIKEWNELWDTDFGYPFSDQARFRCNYFMDMHGPGAVFRTIPSVIVTAQQLGLSGPVVALTTLPKGLVLVTGPTGSGKSTTLAALVDQVNERRKDHIITIEDPIEFVHKNKNCLINQREVHQHTKGFKPALRAALREDPDVILIGELRDLETVEIALETAETGHLVFGTLHTTTAASTVDRIIDQFPADRQEQIRAMLSTSLRAVVAQTLLKRADGRGRVGCFEVLMVTAAVASLIREGKTYQLPSVIQTGGRYGMVLQNSALQQLVKRRTVTYEEALSKAVDREGLERLLPEEAARHQRTFGADQTFSAELGMPVSATEEDTGGPRIQADGVLERRMLKRAEGAGEEGADPAAAKSLASARAKAKLSGLAAPQPVAETRAESMPVDDFEAFRRKLATRK